MSEIEGWGLDTSGAKQPDAETRDREQGEKLFAGQLRAVIQTVDVMDILTAPLESSVKHLLSVAAESFGCDEASVIVRDGNEGELKFMCAIGQVADELLKVKIPAGKGVAGFVFESGQPVVVADTGQESSFYSDIDRVTGYTTQTLLATPLRAGSKIIGVLEFVNRVGDPPFRPFSPEEMDRAAHFATAIAPLVEAYERAGLIESLFERAMQEAQGASNEGEQTRESLRQWLRKTRAATEHRDLMRLAVTLRNIASRGDAEREMCRDVLEALSRFTEKESGTAARYSIFS